MPSKGKIAPEKSATNQMKPQDITSGLSEILDPPKESTGMVDLTRALRSCASVIYANPVYLPACLDCLAIVFKEASEAYLQENRARFSPSMDRAKPISLPDVDRVIGDAEELLGTIIGSRQLWVLVPTLKWCLDVLSVVVHTWVNQKYYNPASLEDAVSLWSRVPVISVLMKLIDRCFKTKLEPTQLDTVVSVYIDGITQLSAHLEWVLVSSVLAYPTMLIPALLRTSLRCFSMKEPNAAVVIKLLLFVFERLLPISSVHIRKAVVEMFQVSLNKEKKIQDDEHIVLCTLPFLLHIASLAPSLVDYVINDIIQIMTPEAVHVLSIQATMRDPVLQHGMVTKALSTLIKLKNPLKLIDAVLSYADAKVSVDLGPPPSKIGKGTCSEATRVSLVLLDELFGCLQSTALQVGMDWQLKMSGKQSKPSNPIISDSQHVLSVLAKYRSTLFQSIADGGVLGRKYAMATLVYCVIYSGRASCVDTIASLLVFGRLDAGKHIFLLELEREWNMFFNLVIEEAVSCGCRMVTGISSGQMLTFIQNCVDVACQERLLYRDNRKRFMEALTNHLPALMRAASRQGIASDQLNQLMLNLLDCVDNIPAGYSITSYHILAHFLLTSLVKVFNRMWFLGSKISIDLLHQVRGITRHLLRLMKSYNLLQHFYINFFIRYVTSERFRHMFGGICPNVKHNPARYPSSKGYLLLGELRQSSVDSSSLNYREMLKNRKEKPANKGHHCLGTHLMTQSALLFLQEVLSFGLSWSPDTVVQPNCNLLHLSPEACSCVARVITQLVYDDGLHKVVWMDEDLLRYSVERDAKSRRFLDSNPILWKILQLIAPVRCSLSACSSVIQSVLASLLVQWDFEKRHSLANMQEAISATIRVVNLVVLAGWLPPCFSLIPEIIGLLAPKDIYLLLSVLWKTLKDCALTPEMFTATDCFGRPIVPYEAELHSPIRELLKNIFMRDVVTFARFFAQLLSSSS